MQRNEVKKVIAKRRDQMGRRRGQAGIVSALIVILIVVINTFVITSTNKNQLLIREHNLCFKNKNVGGRNE